jgi:hypothetical protein
MGVYIGEALEVKVINYHNYIKSWPNLDDDNGSFGHVKIVQFH